MDGGFDGFRFLALIGFAVASLWTPGPNNLLLARSGALFGLRRTIPHCCGVAFGFAGMLFAVALGLGEAFRAAPILREGLRFVGATVMLWLAWRIANPRGRGAAGGGGRAFRFHEAVAFQAINPKGWMMAVTAPSLFVTGAAPVAESAVCGLVFAGIGLTSAFGWAAFGVRIGRLLDTPRKQRAFAVAMGGLLAACAVLLLFEDLAPPTA